jgi:hypothetical protein
MLAGQGIGQIAVGLGEIEMTIIGQKIENEDTHGRCFP